MNATLKMFGLSTLLAIISLTIPICGKNLVWITDADFSFLLQVSLPRVGIIVSSILGGYAGVTLFKKSQDVELKNFSIPLASIAIALLFGGLFMGGDAFSAYVYMYTLICPALIGLGSAKLASIYPMKKGLLVVGLVVILTIFSIILLISGITSRDWIIIIDLGTGMRVLSASLIGALLKIR